MNYTMSKAAEKNVTLPIGHLPSVINIFRLYYFRFLYHLKILFFTYIFLKVKYIY